MSCIIDPKYFIFFLFTINSCIENEGINLNGTYFVSSHGTININSAEFRILNECSDNILTFEKDSLFSLNRLSSVPVDRYQPFRNGFGYKIYSEKFIFHIDKKEYEIEIKGIEESNQTIFTSNLVFQKINIDTTVYLKNYEYYKYFSDSDYLRITSDSINKNLENKARLIFNYLVNKEKEKGILFNSHSDFICFENQDTIWVDNCIIISLIENCLF